MNGKTMATLLEKTRCNTAYLRRHVKVVEMWECEWKDVLNESDVKLSSHHRVDLDGP